MIKVSAVHLSRPANEMAGTCSGSEKGQVLLRGVSKVKVAARKASLLSFVEWRTSLRYW